MLTVEQKETIKKCFQSYSGWGEDAPRWFTCRMLMETSGYKELPFGDVFRYIEELHDEQVTAWCKMQTRLAEERKRKEELEKLKKAEAKKNGQNKNGRTVSNGIQKNPVGNESSGN